MFGAIEEMIDHLFCVTTRDNICRRHMYLLDLVMHHNKQMQPKLNFVSIYN